MWLGHRDSPNQTLIRDPALIDPLAAASTSYPGGHNEGFGDTFKQLFRDFYHSIETGEYANHPTYPTFEDGHHEILVCDAILTKPHEAKLGPGCLAQRSQREIDSLETTTESTSAHCTSAFWRAIIANSCRAAGSCRVAAEVCFSQRSDELFDLPMSSVSV